MRSANWVHLYFCPALSTYVVSPEPTCRHSFFVFFFCHSVSNFLGLRLANALDSGSGSEIPLIQDIEPSNSRARLSHATLRFLAWLRSATLKIFISGVSSQILMP